MLFAEEHPCIYELISPSIGSESNLFTSAYYQAQNFQRKRRQQDERERERERGRERERLCTLYDCFAKIF